MGRITIFTMDNSPNCIRTKRELKDRGIPFLEISLTKHPNKRNDMLSLSDKLTVPQMFINSAYVGGLSQTLKVLKSWERAGSNPHEVYESLVAAASDPTDPRLQPSTDPPIVSLPPPPREMKVISIPSGKEGHPNQKMMSVLEMTELLKTIIPRKDLRYNLTSYRKSFRGSDFVDGLMKHFQIKREEAVDFAGKLQKDHQILHHVCKDHDFKDTRSLYFRLQCDQTPLVLNSYRIWTERVDPDAMSLLRRLKKQLGKILKTHTDADGKVNYKEAANHVDFPAFEEAVCELQAVDFENMEYNLKLAFSINLYNLMIKYAFVKVGIGSSPLGRSAFFNSVGFEVGGHVLTFDDLENGVLRGNHKAPYGTSKPFSSKEDGRLKLAMSTVDHRLHFALNCGAKSSPFVRDFTASCIQEELRIAAQEFCDDDGNVLVQGNTLYLSKIFSWYMEDFGENTTELASVLARYCRGSKSMNLKKLIAAGSVKVKFNNYDWGSDASDFASFSAGSVKADTSRFS
mmetsp:Transcript_14418/g.27025  ORF Transcript_14418/g.27025 Transcript_14418/m.27025 type:complete len:514 (+) Transcript_14418:120-1661(+)